jgi:hypothetical protein
MLSKGCGEFSGTSMMRTPPASQRAADGQHFGRCHAAQDGDHSDHLACFLHQSGRRATRHCPRVVASPRPPAPMPARPAPRPPRSGRTRLRHRAAPMFHHATPQSPADLGTDQQAGQEVGQASPGRRAPVSPAVRLRNSRCDRWRARPAPAARLVRTPPATRARHHQAAEDRVLRPAARTARRSSRSGSARDLATLPQSRPICCACRAARSSRRRPAPRPRAASPRRASRRPGHRGRCMCRPGTMCSVPPANVRHRHALRAPRHRQRGGQAR